MHCCFWTGKPGSINKVPFLFLSALFATRNAATEPCIEPTVGIQPSGFTSTSRNNFINLDSSFFKSSTPSIIGYFEATPLFKAAISALTPTSGGANPGTPISILINLSPVSASILLTILTISLIVAFPTSSKPDSSIFFSTISKFIGVFLFFMFIDLIV